MATGRALRCAAAIAALAVVWLTGCSTGASTHEAADLTVWTDSAHADALMTIADRFEAATGVTVSVVATDSDKVKEGFIRQAGAGSGPDIVMGEHGWLGDLVSSGVVAPIELAAGEFLDIAVEASTYDGVFYQLPFAVDALALVRNADLVSTPAIDFDDLIAKGKASGAMYPLLVEQGKTGDAYHLHPFEASFGAADPVFHTAGVAFASWLGQQGERGAGIFTTSVTESSARATFTAGDAAFWLAGSSNAKLAQHAGINLQVDPIVPASTRPVESWARVKGFFLSAVSQNKVAANDLLVNYFGSYSAQMELFRSSDVLPALDEAARSAARDPIVAAYLAQLPSARPMPAAPAVSEILSARSQAEAKIIGGADADATWRKVLGDLPV